ncbi:hypothetical protein FHS29_001213 [Saccharothrix tamanrassetensis]|uniref:Uncharacterized protein n=1 Tax=Saccharothrix tamanrassetensis TaxID=1051531 RepID=A0A841CCG4_9PSEU|nr:hypothetical protein [Saccharothrix tamanrassetensis]MBB5954643.1 hypothetical protein [Saccharothrix tamanrassetensis]
MSRVSRVTSAGMAGTLAFGALITLLVTVNRPQPVDVRRVDLGPVQPGVLSADATTTLMVLQSTATAMLAPPPPLPVTTTTAVAATTTEPPPSLPATSSSPVTSTSKRPQHRCDDNYVTDGLCVPWRFPPGVRHACRWLSDQGVTRIEVQGRDRHRLDLDFDRVACERTD